MTTNEEIIEFAKKVNDAFRGHIRADLAQETSGRFAQGRDKRFRGRQSTYVALDVTDGIKDDPSAIGVALAVEVGARCPAATLIGHVSTEPVVVLGDYDTWASIRPREDGRLEARLGCYFTALDGHATSYPDEESAVAALRLEFPPELR